MAEETNKENCIEFMTGEKYCTVSLTNRRHINRIKKLYEERKNEFQYLKENQDGSICAKIPLRWLKINAGSLNTERKELTEEEKRAFVERTQAARAKKNQ